MNNLTEVMDKEVINTIAEFSVFEKNLAVYKEKYTGIVYDLDDEGQMKSAKSDRYDIGKTVSALDKIHKQIKAPLLEQASLLDGERKRIKDGLRDVQEGIKSQIETHESAIKERKDALLRKASAIRDLTDFETPPTLDLVAERLAKARDVVIDESFGDMDGYAALNKLKAIEILEPLLAGLEAQAKAEKEAEDQRIAEEAAAQKARDERIAAEAKEQAEKEAAESIERERQAKIEAEKSAKAAAKQAEIDAKEAAKNAERDRIAAEKAAKEAQAEAVRQAEAKAEREAEAKEQAEQARIDAEKAEQAKREANKKHRGKINREAVIALVEMSGVSEKSAKAVITSIAKNEIPAVSIRY